MEYVSMKKLYYKEKDCGEAIYEQRYNTENTIHFDFSIHSHSSFLLLNKEIMMLTESIYMIDRKITDAINYSKIYMYMETWMKYHTLVEEIMMSNRIEGIISTRKDIESVVKNRIKNKDVRYYGLVDKYKYILENDSLKPIFTSNDVRELYDETIYQDVLESDPINELDGKLFRKEAVEIKSNLKAIHKGISPEHEIIKKMDYILTILNNETLPCLLRVALFHYFFSYIHPFYDGNGRMNRLISSYYLSQVLHPYSALQISVSCLKHRKRYYDAFTLTNDPRNRGDLTYFVINFLEIVKEGLEDFYNAIISKKIEYQHYIELFKTDKQLDKTERDILAYLLEMQLLNLEYVTSKDIEEITGKSRRTLVTKLQTLSQLGYLTYDQAHKPYYYHINLEIFEE